LAKEKKIMFLYGNRQKTIAIFVFSFAKKEKKRRSLKASFSERFSLAGTDEKPSAERVFLGEAETLKVSKVQKRYFCQK